MGSGSASAAYMAMFADAAFAFKVVGVLQFLIEFRVLHIIPQFFEGLVFDVSDC